MTSHSASHRKTCRWSIFWAAFALCVFASPVRGQYEWKATPINRDFDNSGNWLGNGPGFNSGNGGFLIRQTNNPDLHPLLRKSTLVSDLWITDRGLLGNTIFSDRFESLTGEDLEVKRMTAIDDGGGLFVIGRSDQQRCQFLTDQLYMNNATGFFMRDTNAEVRDAVIRNSQRFGGNGTYTIPNGGRLILENSRLEVDGGSQGGPRTFRIEGGPNSQLELSHGGRGRLTKILIEEDSTLQFDRWYCETYHGDLLFEDGGGALKAERFKLSDEDGVTVYVADDSTAKIEGILELGNATRFSIDGWAYVDQLISRSGSIRCTRSLSVFNWFPMFPDVNRGGPLDVQFGPYTELRVTGQGGRCGIESPGKIVDIDGTAGNLKLVCEQTSVMYVVAKGIDRGTFSGDLVLFPDTMFDASLDQPWTIAGQVKLADQPLGLSFNDCTLKSASPVTLTGDFISEVPYECDLQTEFTAESGSSVVLAEQESDLPRSRLFCHSTAHFEDGARLTLPEEARVVFLDDGLIESGTIIEGGGTLDVREKGRLQFGAAAAEAQLYSEGILDFGFRSRPAELIRFEQTEQATVRLEVSFPSAPTIGGIGIPEMDEAVLDGGLELHYSGPTPKEGDQVTLFSAKNVRGQFQTVVYPTLPKGLDWELQYGKHTVILEVVSR